MEAEVARGLEAMGSLEEGWNEALTDSHFDSAFGTFEWFHTWAKHFVPTERVVVAAAREGGRLRAAMPLVLEERRRGPVRRAVLRSMANLQTGKYGFIVPRESGSNVLWLMLDRLRSEVPWAQMEIGFVPESARWPSLLTGMKRAGLLGLRRKVMMESPFLKIEGSWEGYLASRKKKVRRNWRYFEDKLEQEGRVEVERIDGGPELDSAVAEALRIEASSWKGDEGTAIANGAAESAFYKELAQRLSRQGLFRLYFLKLNGRRIAFDYCLYWGRRFNVLKTGYDRDFAQNSPGRVLRVLTLRGLFEEGAFDIYDFLGSREAWKDDWTEGQAEPLLLLKLYGTRLAPALALGLGRRADGAKEWLHRHPRAFEVAKSLTNRLKRRRTQDEGRGR